MAISCCGVRASPRPYCGVPDWRRHCREIGIEDCELYESEGEFHSKPQKCNKLQEAEQERDATHDLGARPRPGVWVPGTLSSTRRQNG